MVVTRMANVRVALSHIKESASVFRNHKIRTLAKHNPLPYHTEVVLITRKSIKFTCTVGLNRY
jgi:hypothetical protein